MPNPATAVRDEWLSSPAFGSVNGVYSLVALLLTTAAGGTLAGGGSWLAAGAMLTLAFLLLLAVIGRCMRAVRKSQTEFHSVLMDQKFFMPYCVCPECKVEGLHWLKSAAVSRDRESLLKYYRDVQAGNTFPTFWLNLDEDYQLCMARQWAGVREAKSDVIRECRDCGHSWGQKVGLGFPPVESREFGEAS